MTVLGARAWILAILVSGCGGVAATKSADSAASAPGAPVGQAPTEELEALDATQVTQSMAAAPEAAAGVERSNAPAAPAPPAPAPGAAPASPPAERTIAAAEQPAAKRMLDIEAHFTIQVKDVATAAENLRKLALASNGEVVQESISDAATAPRGQLTLRVPAQAADGFLHQLEGLGSVMSRQVTARDVGKEYYDAALRLQNLEWALARYEQILARANTVDEILRVEEQIARLRGQIEQIKGELRFLQDRVARATVHVALVGPEAVVKPPIVNPEAKLFPGVRLAYLADFRGEDGNAGYAGGGLSLRFAPRGSIDVEGLRNVDSGGSGLDLFLVTIGADLYSDFLGNGQRKWLNPYLGLRGGYARFLGNNEVAAGGSVGLEIFRSELLTVELDGRIYGLFGSDAGAHLVVQPALGANVAF